MAELHSGAAGIGELAQAGERMSRRLRREAFLSESRKGLNVRCGSAEAARLLGCSTTASAWPRRTAASPPLPSPSNSGRRVGYTVEELLNFGKSWVRLR